MATSHMPPVTGASTRISTVDASSHTEQPSTSTGSKRTRKKRDNGLPAGFPVADSRPSEIEQEANDIPTSTTSKKRKLTRRMGTTAPALVEKGNIKEQDVIALTVPPAERHSCNEVADSEMVHCSNVSQPTAMLKPRPAEKAKASAGKVSKMAASSTVEKKGKAAVHKNTSAVVTTTSTHRLRGRGVVPDKSSESDSDSSWSSDTEEEKEKEPVKEVKKKRGPTKQERRPLAKTVPQPTTTSRKQKKQLSKTLSAVDPVKSLRMAGMGSSTDHRQEDQAFTRSRALVSDASIPSSPTSKKKSKRKELSKADPLPSVSSAAAAAAEEEEKEEEEGKEEEEEEKEEEGKVVEEEEEEDREGEKTKDPEKPNQNILSQDLFTSQHKTGTCTCNGLSINVI